MRLRSILPLLTQLRVRIHLRAASNRSFPMTPITQLFPSPYLFNTNSDTKSFPCKVRYCSYGFNIRDA
ncbi:MAG: hypothetical protein ABI480_01705 [Chitinophagaceae bacterium]